MKKHIALLCAAGIGQRMNSNVPKQYLKLVYKNIEQTILEITINKFLKNEKIDAVIVALNQHDRYFVNLNSKWFLGKTSLQSQHKDSDHTIYTTSHQKLFYCFGFGLRFHTVYSLVTNALLLSQINGWDLSNVTVHIHDVARPGILSSEIDHLVIQSDQIKTFSANEHFINSDLKAHVFGVLPINHVVDTVRTIENNDNHIEVHSTLDRNKIALALTPQSVNLLYYSFLLHNVLDLGKDNEYLATKSKRIFPAIDQFIQYYPQIDLLIKNQLESTDIGYNKNNFISDKCKYILSSLTDDIALILYLKLKINAIKFGRNNLKITSPDDLNLAQYYLNLEYI